MAKQPGWGRWEWGQVTLLRALSANELKADQAARPLAHCHALVFA